MACASKYINIWAAGAAGAGSGITIVAGAGTPVTLVGLLAAVGSLCWLISALLDLIACLEAKGKFAEAAMLRRRVEVLEQELGRLKRLAA
jgi:hypothetical protein